MVIYILGTGYCGTTVLGMSLGSHRKIVDMGELSYFLYVINSANIDKFFNDTICNCGKKMKECDYWTNFYPILLKNINKSFVEKYKIHLDYFKKKYPDKYMVDSSMKLEYFQKIKNLDTIYPILITKDVRNWSVSVIKKHGGNIFRRFFQWYFFNKKFLNFDENDNFHIKIGYEEFAIFPDIIFNKICNFLNLKYEENMLFPSNSTSHLVWGNKMRFDKEKKSRIFYDYKWFFNEKVCLPYYLFPFIRSLNNKLVYSNNLIK